MITRGAGISAGIHASEQAKKKGKVTRKNSALDRIRSSEHHVEKVEDDEPELECPQCPFEIDCKNLTSYEMLRLKTHLLFDHSSSSKAAKYISFLIMFCILLSTAAFVIESIPELRGDFVWIVIEFIVSIIFTIEYILRLWSSRNKALFFKSIMNGIDLLAIIPFYVEVILAGIVDISTIRVFRIIRLVRIFRLFKIGRYLEFLHLFGKTITEASEALVVLAVIVSITVVVIASIVFLIEEGTFNEETGVYERYDGEPTPFTSIPTACYWAVTTLSTVGYGDFAPITPFGRLIANLSMIFGIIIFALPLAVIGSTFQTLWEDDKEERKKAKRLEQVSGNLPKLEQSLINLNNNFREFTEFLEDLSLVAHNPMSQQILRAARLNLKENYKSITYALELDNEFKKSNTKQSSEQSSMSNRSFLGKKLKGSEIEQQEMKEAELNILHEDGNAETEN